MVYDERTEERTFDRKKKSNKEERGWVGEGAIQGGGVDPP